MAPVPPGCPPDSIVLSFPVAREFSGIRLDRFIQLRIPRLSRTRAQEIVRLCAYRKDGTKRRPSDRVREGETVLLVRGSFVEPETPRDYGVLFEDEHIFVVDKPTGLPVHPTATYHRNTLTYLFRERYGDAAPHIAHRLDRETSGVLMCGRTLGAERQLKYDFEHRAVDKSYLAIVRGAPANGTGEIRLPMGAVKQGLHLLMEIKGEGDPDALEAVTQYEVIGTAPRHSLLRLLPHTGRQHQLRVHLAAIGCSIVGDKLYGPEAEAPFLEYIETGMTDALRERVGHERQALHAHTLAMRHPSSRAPMTFTAPLAADLRALWASLGGESTERWAEAPAELHCAIA